MAHIYGLYFGIGERSAFSLTVSIDPEFKATVLVTVNSRLNMANIFTQ